MSSPFKQGLVTTERSSRAESTAPARDHARSGEALSDGAARGGGANETERPDGVFVANIRRNTPASGWWLPTWVRAHVDANASVEEVVADVVRRVSESPREETILEAQAVFNSLARDPAHAATIRAAVDRSPLDEVVKGSVA